MNDLIVGLGLVFVIEGLIWALAPNAATGFLKAAASTPQATLRAYGCAAMAGGALLVWLVRG